VHFLIGRTFLHHAHSILILEGLDDTSNMSAPKINDTCTSSARKLGHLQVRPIPSACSDESKSVPHSCGRGYRGWPPASSSGLHVCSQNTTPSHTSSPAPPPPQDQRFGSAVDASHRRRDANKWCGSIGCGSALLCCAFAAS
jgi:hypothetical protein